MFCILKQVLATSCNVSCKLAMSIYDKQISLLYGSSVWGIPSANRYIKLHVNEVEKEVGKQVICLLSSVLEVGNIQLGIVRANKDKNEILVQFKNIDNKLYFYELLKLNPITYCF